MSKKTETKEKLFNATAKIINTDGVFSLTLEAVAKNAGISKGGLLYHFPSKDALIQGMNDYIITGCIQKIKDVANADPCERGKWIRAYITETFNQIENQYELNAAVLAVIATNPKIFITMKEQFEELQNLIENDHTINPVVSMVIKLAMDGLYYNHLYGVMDLNKENRTKVINYLLTLTEEEIK